MTLTMAVEMPDSFSPELKSMLVGLLQRDVSKRLGCRGQGANEVKNHPFFRGIDWRVVYLQRLPPPLIPARGEVNAADAFDIGSFDEEDTKHITLTEADQELYRNFPVVVSERWQHEIAETIFDYINHEADKAEMKRKNKNKLGYQEEEWSDCILHGYVKRLGGTFTATWLTRYLRLYPNRLELYSDSGKPELIFMDQIEEVCNDYVQIKNEQCIVIKMYNHSKYVFTNSDEIGLKEWHVSLKAAHKESLDMLTTMAEKATKIYGAEIPLKHLGKRRQQLQLEANSAVANLEQKLIQEQLTSSQQKKQQQQVDSARGSSIGTGTPSAGTTTNTTTTTTTTTNVAGQPPSSKGDQSATTCSHDTTSTTTSTGATTSSSSSTHHKHHRHQHRGHHHRSHHHSGSSGGGGLSTKQPTSTLVGTMEGTATGRQSSSARQSSSGNSGSSSVHHHHHHHHRSSHHHQQQHASGTTSAAINVPANNRSTSLVQVQAQAQAQAQATSQHQQHPPNSGNITDKSIDTTIICVRPQPSPPSPSPSPQPPQPPPPPVTEPISAAPLTKQEAIIPAASEFKLANVAGLDKNLTTSSETLPINVSAQEPAQASITSEPVPLQAKQSVIVNPERVATDNLEQQPTSSDIKPTVKDVQATIEAATLLEESTTKIYQPSGEDQEITTDVAVDAKTKTGVPPKTGATPKLAQATDHSSSSSSSCSSASSSTASEISPNSGATGGPMGSSSKSPRVIVVEASASGAAGNLTSMEEQKPERSELEKQQLIKLAVSLENLAEVSQQEVMIDPSKRITSNNYQREQDLVTQYEKLNISAHKSPSTEEITKDE